MISLSECKRLHREIWFWLEKHPGKLKSEWPRWKSRGGDVEYAMNHCFACEYAMDYDGEPPLDCTDCPVRWPGHSCEELTKGLEEFDGPYSLWSCSRQLNIRSHFAKQIRNMPWRI